MTSARPNQDCYFCRVSAGLADPFIFENRSFIGIFDTNPVNPGHALVIPRRHVASLFELDATEQADYFDAIHGVRQVIESTDLTDLYQHMLTREDQRERPKDHIQAVLKLPFLGKRPDAYTVGNNDGRAAGRSIDHLHIILIPRYQGDVEDPRGGIRNIIPDRAKYHWAAPGSRAATTPTPGR
ncbi:HIT family protein [Thioalkalivibrio paradoxus]|uniref:HIT family hydrolase n=1 Tax=Thioalkalivibrio paradoxus ARh 1 TaxID=713585 RepID=W0DLZ2_9GAMM|nr:HIT family protein [Thioalkalivibrio paradoxus]AHE98013.1 HIT family hydrolase [Thioalkalivibrio paradoxus ARh 1]